MCERSNLVSDTSLAPVVGELKSMHAIRQIVPAGDVFGGVWRESTLRPLTPFFCIPPYCKDNSATAPRALFVLGRPHKLQQRVTGNFSTHCHLRRYIHTDLLISLGVICTTVNASPFLSAGSEKGDRGDAVTPRPRRTR